ncbi:chaperone protein dnaJ 11 [Populus alba x Populus x berolinensis]|nr:chaperone protein dnaJ 11 [Populus alba x Populus x berolinensis]
MYATSSTPALTTAATAAATANIVQNNFLPSSITTSSTLSRRGFRIKASVSTFPDTIRVDSRNSSLSLYEILRVNPTASQVEIKTAYRSLAKVYHPGVDFIEIHNAYETLSDPAARAVYDMSLSAAARDFYRRAVVYSGGYYTTRRWETDQCW